MQFVNLNYIISIEAVATLVSVGLFIFGWRHRDAAGAKAFTWLMLAVTIWSGFATLMFGTHTPTLKLVWDRVVAGGVAAVPIAWLAFALQYTGYTRWLSWRRLGLVSIPTVLMYLVLLTNEAHELFYQGYHFPQQGEWLLPPELVFGPVGWVNLVYSYTLIMTGTVLIIRSVIRSFNLYRGQALALLLGVSFPFVANIMFVFNLSPMPGIDFTSFCFTLSGVAFAWGLFRYRLFDVTPIARDTLIDRMSDSMLVLDNQNRIIDLNPAAQALVGLAFSQIIGRPVEEIIRPWQGLVDQVADQSQMQSEILIERDGERKYYDSRISPLFDRSGQLTGKMIVVRNITARIEMEQQLEFARQTAETANQAKSKFLSQVSHELRTPLTSVLGFAKIVKKRLTETIFPHVTVEDRKVQRAVSRVESNIDIIVAEGERLTKLINDVLDLAKIEAGGLEWHMEVVSIPEIVARAAAATTALFVDGEVKLRVNIKDDLPLITGDYDRLIQVVVNLISNAFKFTEQGTVTCSAQMVEDEVWVSVVDTGIGIAHENFDKVFKQFVQVSDALPDRPAGTGLGLPICKEIVEHHRGRIWVESELGAGSVFTFALPLDMPD